MCEFCPVQGECEICGCDHQSHNYRRYRISHKGKLLDMIYDDVNLADRDAGYLNDFEKSNAFKVVGV